MAIALTVRGVDRTRRKKIIIYEPTFSSNYAVNGDTLNFLTASNPEMLADAFPGLDLPENIIVEENAGGLAFKSVKGTLNSNHKLKVFQLPNSTGVVGYAPGGGDVKGSANTDVGIASGTLPTNGALLSNLAAANNTTAFTLALQPDFPRNISISFKNINAGASTGNAVDVVIVGTWRGAAQTETISFTALELTSTAQNEVATKYGSKPFSTITSITPSAAQPANWQHGAGPGSKIGLPTDLTTPVEADVVKITKNAANLAVTGLVDTTNMTVNVGALTDGDDVSIMYKSANAMKDDAPLAEFPDATAYPAALLTDDANMRIRAVFRF